MFTGPVGPVEVFFYWPEAVLGDFYWPGAIGSPLALSPVMVVFPYSTSWLPMPSQKQVFEWLGNNSQE